MISNYLVFKMFTKTFSAQRLPYSKTSKSLSFQGYLGAVGALMELGTAHQGTANGDNKEENDF